jgi:hypothetical protein
MERGKRLVCEMGGMSFTDVNLVAGPTLDRVLSRRHELVQTSPEVLSSHNPQGRR